MPFPSSFPNWLLNRNEKVILILNLYYNHYHFSLIGVTCENDEFTCSKCTENCDRCKPKSKVCDGEEDCDSGEDEKDCQSKYLKM